MTTNQEIFRYSDLQKMGYGSRSTLWRAIKNSEFIQPLHDGRGHPIWTREMLEDWKESRQQYVASVPEALKGDS